eukprot:TRINITY_DN66696_c1_g3_i3.p1 TRINITY_DN66696_c1_g3~~TRINITY_DN66696_c1_g3_i3.p1  ORF type:complete len:384 (-),score=37.71 TRINITY_DN66696_c1_g3_i3:180-1331(-)
MSYFDEGGGEELTPIVIDNGTGMVKAGFAGEDAPSAVFPSVVGHPKGSQWSLFDNKETYVGDEAQKKRGLLYMRYPMEHGTVTNWDDMEKVWQHCFFDQLCVDPTGYCVMLTEPPMAPNKTRETSVQVMFETFQVGGLYLQVQAVLSLYCTGRTTGLVCDVGDGCTHTVPAYEGYLMPLAVRRNNVAGRDLTEYLQRLLLESGYNFNTSAEKEIVRELKEKHCYVALDYDEECTNYAETNGQGFEKDYELPDGTTMQVSYERFYCPEILFQPAYIGVEGGGMHHLVAESISKCDIDMRKDLWNNVVLSGGTTMFEGIEDRMKFELDTLAPTQANVKIVAPPERKYSVWLGGALLAGLPSFYNNWITKEEYEESGEKIVHRKCV